MVLKFKEYKDAQILDDMYNAALGHDLLEDTDATDAEIVNLTNPHVLRLIKELTNPVDDAHTDQYMQQLSSASEEARLIKYADLIENTSSVCYAYHILGEKWVNDFYRPILDSTTNTLRKTEFPTYPQTAEYMRSVLSLYANLLNMKRREQPWQYPVRAIKTETEAITEKDLSENIEFFVKRCRENCQLYLKGYLTYDDLRVFLSNLHVERFEEFLRGHRVNWRVTTDNWQDFLEDYHLWRKGEPPKISASKPWLVYSHTEEIEGGIKDGTGASAIDKISFFQLMSVFCIPPEYFQPFPSEYAKPELLQGYTEHDYVFCGSDTWKNDGGLSQRFELGNTFALTDKFGLESTITITEIVPEEDSYKRHANYIGRGFIKGYMAERPHELRIQTNKGNDWHLSAVADSDDFAAFRDFPLWKEWNEYIDAKNDIFFHSILEQIIEKYSASETDS